MTQKVAVIDVGKTNVKLALVDLATGTERAVVTRPNRPLPGPPYRHFDVEGHRAFLLAGLADLHRSQGVDAISVTTHGASCALLDAQGGLAAPVLDYEETALAEADSAYNALRPDFAETGSPRMAMGLNVGAQLHWQLLRDPSLRDRLATLVTYPQYWGHMLTGERATDVTSLGCHTDLWVPSRGEVSGLVDRLGLTGRIAPARRPDEVLGTLLPEIAQATGLPAATPVVVGIHDSNASLLPHLLARKAPFTVVSTGTWVVAMAVGGAGGALDPARDTLVNVNALGNSVPSARFMGGREYDILTGGKLAVPGPADIVEMLSSGTMLLPAVVPDTGPFPGRAMTWIGAEPAPGSAARAVAIGFYLALVTATSLSLIGADGPSIVEGAFSRNAPYLAMLATATARPVTASASVTGTSAGAALLAAPGLRLPAPQDIWVMPDQALADYARTWREAVL
jgi:sugar (pentulose or hexulose) kinase